MIIRVHSWPNKEVKVVTGEDSMIALGSDHAGFELKEKIGEKLTSSGREFKDFGTYSKESCDYPDFALKVCRSVSSGKCKQGILICGTGIGMSISANKVKGIRAALCHSKETAKLAKEHNDANVLALGARVIDHSLALEIVEVFLETAFLSGRHKRRVKKMMALEQMDASIGIPW